MRVLHFVEALKGGPATYLQTLLPFQAATYEAATVLCPQSQAHLLECPGTEIVSYPDTGRNAWGVAALARHFKGQLELARYDIAHLHSTFAGVAGRLGWSRQASGPRLIYCPHGWSFAMDTGIARKGAYAVAEWLLARRADAIINVSANENALAARAGIAPIKSALVPGGIPDHAWSPLPRGRRVRRLLFVGRYDQQKGIDILLKAMARLDGQGFSLTMIGAPVIGRPSRIALPAGVEDLGWQPSEVVAAAMDRADVVVMPSRWEAFGFVALEAMRAARPVIACAVEGLPELVLDGETGLFCRPGCPDALADAIEAISTMDARSMGIRARRRYERDFTAERMFHRIDAVYRGEGRVLN